MLGAVGRALRTPDLRNKILFTIFIIVLYRIGANLPSPGVSVENIDKCIEIINQGGNSDVFTLLNLFSGGALLQLAVFALGIMPYITASIILQLLVVVIPRLEQLKKMGQSGQQKITQYTRYLTVGLAILQASGFIALARSGNLFQGCSVEQFPIIPERSDIPLWMTLTILVITMTAGTAVVMWFGELVTERGLGNGMSLLMAVSIGARLPYEGQNILETKGGLVFGSVLVLVVLVITAVVFIEQAQRRVPVHYAKRMVGRKTLGGSSTYIPLKVNQAGVVPVIFASSLLYLPTLFAQFGDQQNPSGWQEFIARYIQPPDSWVNVTLYFGLIIFFAYFYVAITFNPRDVADNMKKYGGFIPGYRPGKPTADYLDHILSRITLPGALYLGIIAVLPNLFIGMAGSSSSSQQGGQGFLFGGTAVLIMVGVALETVKQTESQLMQRNYEGFLR